MLSVWIGNLGRYLLLTSVSDVLDILIMALLIYKLLTLAKTTSVMNLLKGVLIFMMVLWLSSILHLHAVSFILDRMVDLGVLALIILFQPEIRRILEQMGSQNLNFLNVFSRQGALSTMEHTIAQTVEACADMSRTRTGALIVFEREMLLDDMVRSGTVLDASVSSELLKNIFFVKAPMHDGAVIVRHGRLLGAGCMLPLSKNVNLSRELGMRHRAGIGMSENSDAVVVIVSEESGSISVATGGMLKRHLMPETLDHLLRNELLPQEPAEQDKPKWSLVKWLKARKDGADDDEE